MSPNIHVGSLSYYPEENRKNGIAPGIYISEQNESGELASNISSPLFRRSERISNLYDLVVRSEKRSLSCQAYAGF